MSLSSKADRLNLRRIRSRCAIHRTLLKSLPQTLRNVNFHRPALRSSSPNAFATGFSTKGVKGCTTNKHGGSDMDIFTLYVGQGALAAVRAGDEAIIIDSYMPDCDEVSQEQIEQSLA